MASGRRHTGQRPRLVTTMPEEYNSRDMSIKFQQLQKFLEKSFDSEADGIPSGYSSTDPTSIEAGVLADPGLETTGWAAGDHIHDVLTDVPVSVGAANAEGTSGSLARADHVHMDQQSNDAFFLALVGL